MGQGDLGVVPRHGGAVGLRGWSVGPRHGGAEEVGVGPRHGRTKGKLPPTESGTVLFFSAQNLLRMRLWRQHSFMPEH